MSIKEAARKLGISYSSITQAIRAGRLKSKQAPPRAGRIKNGRIEIAESALTEWQASKRRTGPRAFGSGINSTHGPTGLKVPRTAPIVDPDWDDLDSEWR